MKLRRPILLLLFLIVAGVISRWHHYKGLDHRLVETMQCVDVVKGCIGKGLVVIFSQPPQVMKPFKVLVRSEARQVHASFAMQGMEMGLNRYVFKQAGDGEFVAEVILPVCVQGRSDWVMELELSGSLTIDRYRLPFQATR